MRARALFALLFFLVLITPASAIGISPGRTEINFVPNFEGDFSFSVINNINATQSINVYASGDLAQYITLPTNGTTSFEAGESKTFLYHVKLPGVLEPGRRDSRLGATEAAPPGGMVSAVSGVEMQFWVNVPYPDRYVAVDLTNSRPFLDRPIDLEVVATNPVNQTMDATVDLEIKDLDGTTLEWFDLGSVHLAPGEARTFTKSWTLPHAGYFRATARAHFGFETSKHEAVFGLEAVNGTTANNTKSATKTTASQNPLFSPYTFIIMAVIAVIFAVVLWPEKKKRGEENEAKH